MTCTGRQRSGEVELHGLSSGGGTSAGSAGVLQGRLGTALFSGQPQQQSLAAGAPDSGYALCGQFPIRSGTEPRASSFASVGGSAHPSEPRHVGAPESQQSPSRIPTEILQRGKSLWGKFCPLLGFYIINLSPPRELRYCRLRVEILQLRV